MFLGVKDPWKWKPLLPPIGHFESWAFEPLKLHGWHRVSTLLTWNSYNVQFPTCLSYTHWIHNKRKQQQQVSMFRSNQTVCWSYCVVYLNQSPRVCADISSRLFLSIISGWKWITPLALDRFTAVYWAPDRVKRPTTEEHCRDLWRQFHRPVKAEAYNVLGRLRECETVQEKNKPIGPQSPGEAGWIQIHLLIYKRVFWLPSNTVTNVYCYTTQSRPRKRKLTHKVAAAHAVSVALYSLRCCLNVISYRQRNARHLHQFLMCK